MRAVRRSDVDEPSDTVQVADQSRDRRRRVTGRSILLFAAAAVAEIGGAYLMWQAIKEGRGPLRAAAGAAAPVGYGASPRFSPTRTSDACSRPTAACSSSDRCPGAWSSTASGPDRYDISGAIVCLASVAMIMSAPR